MPKKDSSERMTTAQRVSWYSLLVLVFLVPLATSKFAFIGVQVPLTYDQFDLVKLFVMRVCVIVGLAAWGWHVCMEGGRWRRSRVDFVILAVLVWVALSTVTSIHVPTALFGTYRRYEGLLTFVTYAGAFFLAIQMLDRASKIRTLAKTFFWSGVVVNSYGVLQYFGLDPAEWGVLEFEENRAFSTFGNPEFLGGFAVLALAISLSLALSEEQESWRGIYWGGFMVALASWIVAFTRGAWIAGVFVIILLAVVAVINRVSLKRIDKAFMGAGGVLAAALVALSLRSTDEVMNVWLRLRSILEFDQGSAETRFQIWEAAAGAIADRPVLGFGADTFRLVFPRYMPFEYPADAGYLTVADNVHNYPLQLAAAFGIPGLLLILGLFGYAAYVSAPLVFRRSDSPASGRLVLAGFWAACAGYIVHLLFALSVVGTTVLLWVFMAVVLAPSARSVELSRPRWGTVGAYVCVAIAAVLLLASARHAVADNRHLQAALLTQGAERVLRAEEALGLFPYESAYRAELGMAHMDLFITSLLEFDAVRGTEAEGAALARIQATFIDTERVMLESLDFSPWEFENYIFLSNLYAAAGDYLDSRYYDTSIAIARRGIEEMGFEHDARLRFQLARALRATGTLPEAFEQVSVAVELAPTYAEARVLHAELAEQLGDPEGAEQSLEEALQYLPGDQEILSALERLRAGTPNP